MLKPLMMKIAAFPPVKADLVLGDNDQSLEEFGISGKIIYTPGHTFGSVSVLLDSGEAFIGCLIQNKAPFVLKPRLPVYAKDIELLKKSLKPHTRQMPEGLKICLNWHTGILSS